MKHITKNDILSMTPRYRAQLINSLPGSKSANLIGTISQEKLTNLAIFSSVIHLGSDPALVGFIMRPNTVERHTLENIQQTKQYTINQISHTFWQAAHQTSARYLKSQCEFEQTGLSPEYIDGIDAPFVAESALKFAVYLKEIIPIEVNGTLLIIGEVNHIISPEEAIQSDGYIDTESLNTVSITGLDSYHVSERLSRLSYAKPNIVQQKLNLDGSASHVTSIN